MASWVTEHVTELPEAPTGDADIRLKQKLVCKAGAHEAAGDPTVSSNFSAPAALDFREGAIEGVKFRSLIQHADERGWLAELFREDELDPQHLPVMVYISVTLPGVTRGPHEHRDQTDSFFFVGPGDFRVRLWDARQGSLTFGNTLSALVGESSPQAIVVPPGVVHAYRNESAFPGWTFNAPNRLYRGRNKAEPVDEIRHELTAHPYQFERTFLSAEPRSACPVG